MLIYMHILVCVCVCMCVRLKWMSQKATQNITDSENPTNHRRTLYKKC